jgi:ABC-type transport system substrate-binding protein
VVVEKVVEKEVTRVVEVQAEEEEAEEEEKEETEESLEVSPQEGGTLRVVQPLSPTSLDPMVDPGTPGIHVVENLYDGLMRIHPEDDSIGPSLAEDWTISSDELVWSFDLREDVEFHNGDLLTADDVIYTFERMMDPEGPATFKSMYINAIERVEKTGDFKVDVHLKQPWPAFPIYLAANHLKILNERAVEEAGDQYGFTTVVGTGPFKFERWEKDAQIVVVKNEDYWMEEFPRLDKIVYRLIADPQVGKLALETGEVDVLQDPPLDQVPDFQENPDVKVKVSNGAANMIIDLNTAQPPFDDKRVRQAVSMAIDRQEIADVAFYGTAEVANDFFPSWFWADDPEFSIPYDPEQAKELLAEAGYSEGDPLEFSLMVYNFPPYTDMGQLVQAQLAEIGVQVEVRSLAYPTVIGYLKNPEQRPEMQAALMRHTARTSHWEFTGNRYAVGGKLNWWNYNKPGGIQNPRAQELFDEVEVLADYEEADRAAAKPIYEELSQIVWIEDVPQVMLVHGNNVDILQNYVENWPNVSKDSSANYMKVWLSQ